MSVDMSDYLDEIVENFDPMDHITPSEEELEEELPSDATSEQIQEAFRELRTEKERGGAMLVSKILAELHHLSNQARTRIDEVEQSPVVEWDGEQKDDIHLYFAFVGQVQEHLLRDAVIQYVISDAATTEAIKRKIMSNEGRGAMPASECIDYLYKGEIIDNGLKSEIKRVRDERNEAVHDLTRWIFAQPDPSDLRREVLAGERSVVRLIEVVYGFDLEK